MIRYIVSNKKWIFSGIGVLAISLLIAWAKSCKFAADQHSDMVAEERTGSVRVDSYSHAVRIKVGDFYIFTKTRWPVRVQLVAIKPMPHSEGDSRAEVEDGALLNVDMGGALVFGGRNTAEVRTNSFLVPVLDPTLGLDEPQQCLFNFDAQDENFWFVRLCVTHINPVAQTVDVSLREVRD